MRGPLVCATLEDRKWQTRRVVKPTQTTPRVAPLRMEPWMIDGVQETDDNGLPCWVGYHPDYPGEAKWFSCPHGGVGDRLWVRETWQINHVDYDRGPIPKTRPTDADILYRADGEFWEQFEIDEGGSVWRPSIFMPRWASRLTLEIAAVRVERVQDISEEDCIAEGITWPNVDLCTPRGEFSRLWSEINAKRGYGWESNPYVWAISYRRIGQ